MMARKRSPAVPPPREAEVLRVLLQWFKLRGWPAWRFNSGALTVGDRFVRFHTARGCSDILFVAPGGRFGACEVKREGGKPPTALQQSFLVTVGAAGGIAVCVRSVAELEERLIECGICF
jgi:hypothetical protein